MSTVASAKRELGYFRDYLSLARFDHSSKHIFIVPGVIIAYLLRGPAVTPGSSGLVMLGPRIALGFVAAICIASANYVINEYLDRDFDRFHPTKSRRASVQREMDGRIIWLMWSGLLVAGLTASWLLGMSAFLVMCVFAVQGIVYNVPPLRTKNKPYLDVISESINNPLRLMLGWAMVDVTTLAPGSMILAYWLGGAFLMAAKRLSEYREITGSHGKDVLIRYRVSFAGYTETSLTVSCFIYGLLSSFFLAVFLIKYRIEYLLLMPFIAILFGYYLALSLRAEPSVQHPEKLFKEPGLMLLITTIAGLFVLTTIHNFPALTRLTEQHYIDLQ